MPIARIPENIASALERSATIITSTQRSARTLRLAANEAARAQGKLVWQPAQVLAWQHWTASLWSRLLVDGHEDRLLLSSLQEHAAWRSILDSISSLATLQSKDALASLATRAWSLLAQHNITDARGHVSLLAQFARGTDASSDAREFAKWAEKFGRHCEKERLLPAAQLECELLQQEQEKKLFEGPQEFMLVGFDRMTPAQSALCDALIAQGHTLKHTAPPLQPAGTRLIVNAASPLEELRAAASWIRGILEQRPDARIAVIVPDIAAIRRDAERIFTEAFAPELLDIATADVRMPFEFSLGTPLARTQMVRDALTLMRWITGPLPMERVSPLLLSPYIAGAEMERMARARLDAFTLRQADILQPDISLDWLLRMLDKVSGLASQLQSMLDKARERRAITPPGKKSVLQSYGSWMETVSAMLSAVGWPGDRTLNSDEFQLQKKWAETLEHVAALDFSGDKIFFQGALHALEHAASETLFAPESHNAPVQIMGVLESAGSNFDALWFLCADDLHWPPKHASSPFLPWALQRKLGIPGSDSGHDLEDALQAMQRIAASAGDVVFSYAREDEEGAQRPSHLLNTLAGFTKVDAKEVLPAKKDAPAPAIKLEEFSDPEDTDPLPDKVIYGGVGVLKSQAACPFRAFAEWRLSSRELESSGPGLDAKWRGEVVHKILARFWKSFGENATRSALQSLPSQERSQRLQSAIKSVLEEIQPTTEWDRSYLHVQRQWLMQLLSQWLEIELQRPEFRVTQCEEEIEDIRIGPLRLSLRLDRRDEVNGGDVILDYKTGLASRASWAVPRPEEPQLPLYAAVTNPKNLKGIAFASVRAGEMGINGWSSEPDILRETDRRKDGRPTAKSEVCDLNSEVDQWRDALKKLAVEFCTGQARVVPKNYPLTCDHCSQRPLCRIQEIRALSGMDNEADDETAEVDA